MSVFYFLMVFKILCNFHIIIAEPIVKISLGTLNGITQKSRNGRNFSAFLGVPYAEPPIGNLRFKNPEPAKTWRGTRSANLLGNICPQFEEGRLIGNEDCLLLNVYTPLLNFNSNPENSTLMAVMVWIHGGGFAAGSSNIFGAEYFLDKNVILVTINYRLGILGFLSTGDSVAPGNFGMKDQVLALKWVQENIIFFGGDKQKVTIFGSSAGGGSVSLHAVSKASTGLFSGYIIQSGTVLAPWLFKNSSNLAEYAKEIGVNLQCPSSNSTVLVNCLRGKPINEIIITATLRSISRFDIFLWSPTDESDDNGAFLTDNPTNLVKNNQMKDLPFMSGTVADEGLVFTRELYSNTGLSNSIKLIMNATLTLLTKQYFPLANESTFISAVNKFYFNNSATNASQIEFLDSMTRFISDGFFCYPQKRTLELVTSRMRNSNYFYNFGYRGTNSFTEAKGDKRNLGVSHDDDLLYLFPMNFRWLQNSSFTVADKKMSRIMIDLWSSFAINRKPTSMELSDPNLWKPYTCTNRDHIQIGNIFNNSDPRISMSNSYYTERMDFWSRNVPI